MRLTRLFKEFFASEQSSSIVLILCTLASLVAANSPLGASYIEFWHRHVGLEAGGVHLKYSLEYWINDGLMAVFFLLIGLEIERELYGGELSNWKNASLPLLAAAGGMAFPALFHFLFNRGTEFQHGFGIPMATDIAFALGVLALLGSKIPASLKIFLAALAIVDDLGAIAVIALFYTNDLSILYLALAFGVYLGLLALNRLKVYNLWAYLIPGLFMWYFMLQSGVHATLAGVLLAFALPYGDGGENSLSYKVQHFLHKPVAFFIVPLFALANTGILLKEGWVGGLQTSNSLGIFMGLFIGKPLGIIALSLLAIRMGWSRLPTGVSWRHIIGAGFLGGIGFTMSIFITLLAFSDPQMIQSSKITVLLTSLLSGAIGYLILNKRIHHVEQHAT
ncbi:MAG TPA: Na+/H+ antiporter NhaA [Anaerolineales bacterium]|nr:Na+/H+ antiporter NhaA [Anaerolineales bacterium]